MEELRNIPEHIAIIMDGNGRWAAQHGHERLWGHSHGVESVRSVVKKSVELGVRYLTIYAFSTENWGRPQDEVEGLMKLLSTTIGNETEELAKSGVRLKFIGNTDVLPENLKEQISKAENIYIETEKLTLIIALNYSSRWEITTALRNIVKEGIDVKEINETLISDHLCTRGIPDPDLLIRTSGEIRLSNFLLWQLSYSEMYFTKIFWPDFDGKALEDAIAYYSKRNRRWGKI